MNRRIKNVKPLEPYTIYLNTEQNCIKNTVGAMTKSFTWNVSPIVLNEYSVLRLASIAHDASSHGNHDDNILSFRIKGVIYNPELYRNSDNSPYPIIFSSSWHNNEFQYWNSSIGGIRMPPQTINNITLIASESLADAEGGVNSALSFMIGITIEPYDVRYSDYEN
jgi:hypothetical protein